MAAVAAVAALAFGYFMVNLGAAKSPVANTRGLPVAIVDRDAGAVVGGERMGVGGDMVDEATASEKIGDKVEWTRLDSRSEAARGISEGRYYGALVIPEDLSEKVGELSGGPEVPVAIANQDRGATMAGRDVEFGERVVGSVTDDPALEGVVRWTEVADAGRALKGMEDGEYAGAIVVPEDYSERLAGLAVTPTGETPPAGAPGALDEPRGGLPDCGFAPAGVRRDRAGDLRNNRRRDNRPPREGETRACRRSRRRSLETRCARRSGRRILRAGP